MRFWGIGDEPDIISFSSKLANDANHLLELLRKVCPSIFVFNHSLISKSKSNWREIAPTWFSSCNFTPCDWFVSFLATNIIHEYTHKKSSCENEGIASRIIDAELFLDSNHLLVPIVEESLKREEDNHRPNLNHLPGELLTIFQSSVVQIESTHKEKSKLLKRLLELIPRLVSAQLMAHQVPVTDSQSTKTSRKKKNKRKKHKLTNRARELIKLPKAYNRSFVYKVLDSCSRPTCRSKSRSVNFMKKKKRSSSTISPMRISSPCNPIKTMTDISCGLPPKTSFFRKPKQDTNVNSSIQLKSKIITIQPANNSLADLKSNRTDNEETIFRLPSQCPETALSLTHFERDEQLEHQLAMEGSSFCRSLNDAFLSGTFTNPPLRPAESNDFTLSSISTDYPAIEGRRAETPHINRHRKAPIRRPQKWSDMQEQPPATRGKGGSFRSPPPIEQPSTDKGCKTLLLDRPRSGFSSSAITTTGGRLLAYHRRQRLHVELSSEILEFSNRMKTKSDLMIKAVNELGHEISPLAGSNISLVIFGSVSTGMITPLSDIDFGLKDPTCNSRESEIDTLTKVAQKLELQSWVTECRLITGNVPVIKTKMINTHIGHIGVDIVMIRKDNMERESSATRTTSYVTSCLESHPCLKTVFPYLKYLMGLKGFSSQYDGGLNSYSLLILLVYFVVSKNLPKNSEPGKVLIEFCQFFGEEFDYGSQIVDLNNPYVLSNKQFTPAKSL